MVVRLSDIRKLKKRAKKTKNAFLTFLMPFASIYHTNPRARIQIISLKLLTSKSIASIDDVAMLGEAAKHVFHTLLQCIELGVDEHFGHQMIRGKLNQPLT